MLPLISIVIINYNREKYLGAAIESILNQTWQNLELLVWDDGSTDNSVKIAHQYAQVDSRVKVVAATHQGVTVSRQQATSQTTGVHLKFFSSDDLLNPTDIEDIITLSQLNNKLQQKPWQDIVKTTTNKIKAICCKLTPYLIPLMGIMSADLANAQIVPDGTAGTNVNTNGNTININGGTTSGNNLFHSFQQFGLSESQIANFLSNPNIQNILGRITGGDVSIINGLIQVTGSNANLYLMNPAGFIFGNNASLNLPGAFTVTTAHGIGFDENLFNAFGTNDYSTLIGNPTGFVFPTNSQGSIINAGNLAVGTGQSLNLLGATVANTGTLTAPAGQISVTSVASGNWVRLSQPGNLLSLEIQPFSGQNQPNSPNLSIASLPELLTVGGNTGLTTNTDGTVQVTGSDTKLPSTPGTTIVSGSVDVSGNTGGKVNILGDNIAVMNGNIKAEGNNNGGEILIGGDFQGNGTLPNATNTYVGKNSLISANSTNNGNGGRVIVWADDSTKFFGDITARGGINGGNGGFVEVSGKNLLTFNGQVDTSAINGQKGTLLLDPTDLTIIDDDVNPGTFDTSFSGTIADTDDDIGANTISWRALAELGSGANIDLQATGDITINSIEGNTEGVTTPGVASLNLGNSGSFSLTSTNGSVNFANINDTIRTNGGSISILAGDSLSLGNLDSRLISSPNTFSETNNGGNVTLNATGAINVGNINTSITDPIFSSETPTAGNVNITSTLGSITAENIDSFISNLGGGNFTGTGGEVTLNARNNITVNGLIDTSATVFFQEGTVNITGGDVTLSTTNPFGSTIQFQSINTEAATGFVSETDTINGGNVAVITNGLVRGIEVSESFGNTISTGGLSTTFVDEGTITTPIAGAGGTITIQHDGGADNDDFVVGNSSLNGTEGSLSRGDVNLPSGNFPVLPNGGDAASTPTGITITSVNTPPSITSPVSLTVEENQPVAFTFDASTTDVNGDNTTVEIDSILTGTLRRGDTVLTAGDTISVGETLTYTPPTDTTGTIDAFTVAASDRVSVSTPANIAVNITPSETPPETPETPEPTPDPEPCTFQCETSPGGSPEPPEITTNQTTTIIDPDPIPEDKFTDTFISKLGVPYPTTTTTIEDARNIANNIEAATGIKPAFIYLSFVPVEVTPNSVANKQLKTINNPENNQLEVIVVTGTANPIRKRIANVSQAEVLKVAQEFTTQIVAPQYRTRKSYLQPAQKLYNWIIKPIEADLQAQGIQNLVFLPDVGLRSTPIAAFHDGQQFLIEKYSVGLMPSLSLTNTLYTDIKQSQVLAMGVSESTQGQQPLPAVPVEITTLINKLWSGKLLLNQQATIDNLKSLRNQQPFGIIHLATHADFLGGEVKNSYIQLWENKLRLNQIRQLRLNNPQVEMLVLSACRSALGNEEAEIGFAGLAVLAGVKTSVASLWAVGDTATAALMTKFYGDLRTAPIRAEALRQAQVAMAKGEVYLENGQLQGLEQIGSIPLPASSLEKPNQSLAHPYYWAAFTMVGNPW